MDCNLEVDNSCSNVTVLPTIPPNTPFKHNKLGIHPKHYSYLLHHSLQTGETVPEIKSFVQQFEKHILQLNQFINLLHLQKTLFLSCEEKIDHLANIAEDVNELVRRRKPAGQEVKQEELSGIATKTDSNSVDLFEYWKDVCDVYEIQMGKCISNALKRDDDDVSVASTAQEINKSKELKDSCLLIMPSKDSSELKKYEGKDQTTRSNSRNVMKYIRLLGCLSEWLDQAMNTLESNYQSSYGDTTGLQMCTEQQRSFSLPHHIDSARSSSQSGWHDDLDTGDRYDETSQSCSNTLHDLELQVVQFRHFVYHMEEEKRPMLTEIRAIRKQLLSEKGTTIDDLLQMQDHEQAYRRTIRKWKNAIHVIKLWNTQLQRKFSRCPELHRMIHDFQYGLADMGALLKKVDQESIVWDSSTSRSQHQTPSPRLNVMKKCLKNWHARMCEWRSHIELLSQCGEPYEYTPDTTNTDIMETRHRLTSSTSHNEITDDTTRRTLSIPSAAVREDFRFLRREIRGLVNDLAGMLRHFQERSDADSQSSKPQCDQLAPDISDLDLQTAASSCPDESINTSNNNEPPFFFIPSSVQSDNNNNVDANIARMEAIENEYCDCCCCTIKHESVTKLSNTDLPVNFLITPDPQERRSRWRRRMLQGLLLSLPIDIIFLLFLTLLLYFRPSCEKDWTCITDLQRLVISKHWENPAPT